MVPSKKSYGFGRVGGGTAPRPKLKSVYPRDLVRKTARPLNQAIICTLTLDSTSGAFPAAGRGTWTRKYINDRGAGGEAESRVDAIVNYELCSCCPHARAEACMALASQRHTSLYE